MAWRHFVDSAGSMPKSLASPFRILGIPIAPPLLYLTAPTMEFLEARSPKYVWTFILALGLGTALPLGGYIYSEYTTRRAFRKYTAVDDLSVLGRKRKAAQLKGTVVIAGGRYIDHRNIQEETDVIFYD